MLPQGVVNCEDKMLADHPVDMVAMLLTWSLCRRHGSHVIELPYNRNGLNAQNLGKTEKQIYFLFRICNKIF